jgi:hypothetical protein
MRVRSIPSKFAFLMLVAMFAVPAFAQQPRKESLLNGLKVLMFPDPSSDKVWVRIRVNSGSAFDPQGKEGLMQILSANFFPTDTAKEYFRDELGGSLAITANYDYIEVDASSKPDDLVQMLETLSSGISNTGIDKDTTAKLKTDLTVKVKQLEADPNYVADRAAAKRLFGTFPYGRPIYGTEDSIKKIDVGDLLDAKQRFLTADNSTMAISGNFQPNRILPAVKRYFGGWTKADRHVPATFRQAEDPDTAQLTINIADVDTTYSRWARRAPGRADEGYAVARVAAEATHGCYEYTANLLSGIWLSGDNSPGNGLLPIHSRNLCPRPTTISPLGIDEQSVSQARDQILSRENDPGSLERRWLDVDTYKLSSPDYEITRLKAVTISEVRAFETQLTATPRVSILLTHVAK